MQDYLDPIQTLHTSLIHQHYYSIEILNPNSDEKWLNLAFLLLSTRHRPDSRVRPRQYHPVLFNGASGPGSHLLSLQSSPSARQDVPLPLRRSRTGLSGKAKLDLTLGFWKQNKISLDG